MIIPPERLTVEVLRNLVESFITREGTDYGEIEITFAEKVEQLLPKVIMGEVLVVFDEVSESVTLIPRESCRDAKLAG